MTVPLYNLTDVWNSAGTVFTAIAMNVTNTASAAGSKLLDLQVSSTSQFSVDPAGGISWPASVTLTVGSSHYYLASTGKLYADILSVDYNSGDVELRRDAANILGIRYSTSPMTLRVYNTYTDASNYERGALDWTTTANVLTIGTQKLGTGSVRNIQFVVGNTAQADFGITTSGAWTFNATTYVLGDCRVAGGNVRIDNGTVLYWSGADLFLSRKAANVFSLDAGAVGDSNATINAKTKAGAPTTSDVPAGTWVLIRDTSGATTKLYYNNAGTLQSVALV